MASFASYKQRLDKINSSLNQIPTRYEIVIVNDVWVNEGDKRRGRAIIRPSESRYRQVDYFRCEIDLELAETKIREVFSLTSEIPLIIRLVTPNIKIS
ncbi:hypothetical protein [Psychrosphaera algicola]|uniref:30S ribosomal protein S10 n=1 Tax=Psychrosphaera algicola TaxID=3023714 RepID=A0ABT5FAF0_9GAMM|nr:hypothetical protein [Psychrosphaera sp. G1-22]MDC2888518.1 hypothetical protein [Psychrosphaera sp. G1-22]